MKAKTKCLSNKMKNIFAFILMFILVNTASAQSFQNGDLEGVVNGASCLPNYWLNVPYNDTNCIAIQLGGDTPDLTDINGPFSSIGVSGLPFSGNTFVSGGIGGHYYQEGIMQTVSGFTVNNKYNLHFRQAVLKQYGANDYSGSWAVYFDTTLILITNATYNNKPIGSQNLYWESRTIDFYANHNNILVKFLPIDNDSIYSNRFPDDTLGSLRMAIDSIGLDILTGVNEVNVDNSFTV